MLTDKRNPLYPEFREYIEPDSVRAVYDILIGAAAAIPGLSCGPERKGAVRDFRFYSEPPEQPFAFIINQRSLLFYLRQPAVRSKLWSLAKLENQFSEVNENNAGEWTIKIYDRLEAVGIVEEVLNVWR